MTAARDRPLIFSAPMVRAILDGRKTQTRRILKLPKKTHSGGPIYERPDMGGWEATTSGGGGCFMIGRAGERIPVPEEPAIWHRTTGTCMAMPWKVGDRAWVREAWAPTVNVESQPDWPGRPHIVNDDESVTIYRADGEWNWCDGDGFLSGTRSCWRSPIHMPRWASRLTLLIEDVRVQRLQEISDSDCDAECFGGDFPHAVFPDLFPDADVAGTMSLPRCFGRVWDSIHGPGAWDANPWVCALSFRAIHANIDALDATTPAGEWG